MAGINKMYQGFIGTNEKAERDRRAIQNLQIPNFDTVYGRILQEIPELKEVDAAELAVTIQKEFEKLAKEPYGGIFTSKKEQQPSFDIFGWRNDVEMYDKMRFPTENSPMAEKTVILAGAEFNIIVLKNPKRVMLNYVKSDIHYDEPKEQ